MPPHKFCCSGQLTHLLSSKINFHLCSAWWQWDSIICSSSDIPVEANRHPFPAVPLLRIQISQIIMSVIMCYWMLTRLITTSLSGLFWFIDTSRFTKKKNWCLKIIVYQLYSNSLGKICLYRSKYVLKFHEATGHLLYLNTLMRNIKATKLSLTLCLFKSLWYRLCPYSVT